MGSKLVIVESPTKCKTISRYLGDDYIVKATMGHISDLPVKKLGVDLENNFQPEYEVVKGKKKLITELRKDAKSAEAVYLAPDPDREGEAIAWHVAEAIGVSPDKIKRIQFNEITKNAVQEAISNPHEINMERVNAQQARRVLDRIVGYQVSPILWKLLYRGLSAGRVQSVALRIICEREDEINAFEPVEYWSITAYLNEEKISFSAKLHSFKGEKAVVSNEAEAKTVLDSIEGKPFKVSDVVKSEKKRKPYPPFITSTLQQDAARSFGYSASKTMMIAQQLYEGVEVGKFGTVGLITYMRTDSTRISTEALTAAQELISKLYDERYGLKNPRQYGKVKNAQEAHEAIRPSYVEEEYQPSKIKQFLTDEQFKVYQLIWNRFMASQMADAVIDATRIDFNCGEAVFRANGSVIKFDGFLTLYDESKEDSTDSTTSDEGLMPDLQIDRVCEPQSIEPKQHFTKPPARYSEALLVKELERLGIGRPSTYAQIINTLQKRQYVTNEKKRFSPTELGQKVKEILCDRFNDIFEVNFTADMETRLDSIEEGSVAWQDVMKEFYGPFSEELGAIMKGLTEDKKKFIETTDTVCPECKEHNLIVKWSRNGKFLACPGFPKCKYTESLDSDETKEETDKKCDLCGAPMFLITRGGNKFYGCSAYPDCKNTKPVTTGISCPKDGCSGELSERKSRYGKVFYGCTNYPTCDFACWDPPIEEKCSSCDFPILTVKSTKRKGDFKLCPSCKAEFPLPPSEEDEADE